MCKFCLQCGKELTQSQTHYCSISCRNRRIKCLQFERFKKHHNYKRFLIDPLRQFDSMDDVLGKL